MFSPFVIPPFEFPKKRSRSLRALSRSTWPVAEALERRLLMTGPATQLVYAQQPSNVTAGAAENPFIVVDVEDQNGNIVTTDNSTVMIAVASGPGSVSGTLAATSVNGVATFSNVEFNTAGNYTLTATDGDLTSATSNTFTVVAPTLAAPSGLTAIASGTSSVALNWTDNDSSATDYTILRSVNGGSYITLATLNDTNSPSICNMTFSDASGDAGTITVNCAPSGLGDGSIWATSGSLTVTSSSDTADVPLGVYPLIANSAPSLSQSSSPSGAFVFDNLVYPGNNAPTGSSYMTNGGLVFGNGGGAIEINIWGNGGGDYAFYAGYNSGNYPIAVGSGGIVPALATFCSASSYTDSTVTVGNTYAYEVVASNATGTSDPSASTQVTLLGPPSKLVYAQQPTNVTAGVADSPSIVVDVEDQYGNIVTTDSSNVTLAVAGGPGSLTGTVTVAASNGVATFGNVKLDTAGNYTLTASDGTLTSATSSSFAVSPAAASQLVYGVQPSNVTAGVADSPSIAVDLEDQFGNIVTSDTSNVTLTVANGPGSLGGTVTVAASGGIATFSNVKLNTSGSYTLTASDGGLTSAASNSFTVSPAAALRLVYAVQPSNVTADIADSPSVVVDVVDQFGNVVTTDSSNVTLSVATGPGSATGTLTVAASGGIATFGNVKLDTAGSYTLTASDGGLTSATSNSFTVSSAAASKVVYAVQPSNVTAGVADSPSIVVDVEDQFGNIVTTDNSNVTLAVASGPGSATSTLTVAATNGVATFSNVKLDTAGGYTLTAADGSLASATSNSFTVSPAAASKVVYGVQPSNVTAGVADTPSIVVDVEDQYGNIVTTDSSDVTLAVATGPGNASGTLTVAASNGVATFSNIILDTSGVYSLTASDGSLTSAASTSFTVSPAAASKVVYGTEPSNVTAGVADSPSIVVEVEDQFGNIVASDSSNVTLAVATGPGNAGGTLTVAASSGVATFSNLILNTAGTYTLTASDGSLTSAASNSFTVSPAAASKVVYGVQPNDVTAGVADSPSITLDVEDPFGNIVTSDSSNVTLAVASGPGSLTGTVTVAASGGIATFSNVKLNTFGVYTLTASDSGLTSATSNSFTVSPAAASKVAYAVQPSNVMAGLADSPSIVIDVEDQFGNIVTSDSSDVTLAVASGPGSLSGTVTVAASGGIANFSNVKLDTAGIYTLTASDGGLNSATSNSFTVSPASASKVVYAQQPSNVMAGAADSPSIVLDVEDQFGNIVTTDSSNVTLTIATGPGALLGTVTAAASNGVVTFTNVKLNTAGTYTLTAADGSLTSATSNSFTVNPAAPSHVVYAVQPSDVTAGIPDNPSIVVDVEDQYGNIVTTDNSNVILTVATGPGTLGGTDTVSAASGVATFSNVMLNTSGNYTLTATDGNLASSTSNTFTVSPAAASQLVYAVQPSNVTAGAAQSPSIVVDVEDQFGNIVTTDSSNVTLTVASGPGTLGGTDTVAASGGVATFTNVVLTTAGAYTLIASDSSLTTATSNSFLVSPVSASKVVYGVQPSNVTAGIADSPSITVDIEDQYGNVVTTDSSTVSLTVATGPGTLGGTDTIAASDGVATFDDVKLDTAGSYTLTATDGGLTSATSNSFTVSPASASKVVYAQQPSNVMAGVADSPSIVVDVEDQYGNIVTTDNSNVTVTVATGPGSLQGTLTVAASAGVATFDNVNLDTAGSYTLTGTDDSLTSATSSSFTVNPAAATKLAFTQQPVNVQPGDAISPAVTVSVEDQYGNVVTTDSSDVAISLSSGPGPLGGTLEATSSSGVATFSDLTLDQTGSYTLTATDGSLTSAISDGFTVGTAVASRLEFIQQPTDATAAAEIAPPITVEVVDQYGNLVTTDDSTITLAVASGPENGGGHATVSGGIATFSAVALDTAGGYTLIATDGDLTSVTSNSFTISPAAPSQLAYSVQPGDVTAGAADAPSIVVDVEDQYGNIVTTDSSNVTLEIATGPGVLGGTDTVAASDGVATFTNVKLNTAGSYTLTAEDASLSTTRSSSFTVNPAAATQLAFAVQPSNVTAGVANNPSIVVDVEDQYGNIVTTDSSNVTLAVATGPGSLGGTDTLAASAGVATFSNVILDTAGNYTLQAADGALNAAISNPFAVNSASGTVSQVVVVNQSSSAPRFGNSPVQVIVAAESQGGNLVASGNSVMTANLISISSGGAITESATAPVTNGFAYFDLSLPTVPGVYDYSIADGSATETSAEFHVGVIPLKWQWWFSAQALSSPIIFAIPPIGSSAIPRAASPASSSSQGLSPAAAYASPSKNGNIAAVQPILDSGAATNWLDTSNAILDNKVRRRLLEEF